MKYRVAFSDDLQCPWEERNEEGTENDLWIMGVRATVIQGAFRKSWHHGYHWVVMSLPGRPPLEIIGTQQTAPSLFDHCPNSSSPCSAFSKMISKQRKHKSSPGKQKYISWNSGEGSDQRKTCPAKWRLQCNACSLVGSPTTQTKPWNVLNLWSIAPVYGVAEDGLPLGLPHYFPMLLSSILYNLAKSHKQNAPPYLIF